MSGRTISIWRFRCPGEVSFTHLRQRLRTRSNVFLIDIFWADTGLFPPGTDCQGEGPAVQTSTGREPGERTSPGPLLDAASVIARQNLVSVRHEQLALEERCNVVNLQLLGPRLELLDRDLYARRVLAPLMSVQLDLLLDSRASCS
jgi:hypothetical protein